MPIVPSSKRASGGLMSVMHLPALPARSRVRLTGWAERASLRRGDDGLTRLGRKRSARRYLSAAGRTPAGTPERTEWIRRLAKDAGVETRIHVQ